MLTANPLCGRLHLSIMGWHISLQVYSVSICGIIFYDWLESPEKNVPVLGGGPGCR